MDTTNQVQILDDAVCISFGAKAVHHHYHQVGQLVRISLKLYLANRLYHPSFPARLLVYILYPYIAVVDKFLLVGQYFHVRV